MVAFVFLLAASVVAAFDEAELDVFDVVEEVNQNFYDFMELKSDCSASDIRKAYRRLSLVLHPDKNDAEDAETQFRFLVAIYEVLKDKEKREIYDRVLVEGLPDWKMPVYYYRRMRKMGLAEGLAYLIGIVTVCQYFINWAAYWERKFTLREAVDNHKKRIMKKAKKGQLSNSEELTEALKAEELNVLGPKPTCFDTLPFQMFRGVKAAVLAVPGIPALIYGAVKEAKEAKEEERRRIKEEEEEKIRKEEDKKKKKEQRVIRKQVDKEKRYRDRTGEVDSEDDRVVVVQEEDVFSRPKNAMQIWTDQDLAKLARLMKKYPAGTQERWERIAGVLERFPEEVTKMAHKVKNAGFQVQISRSAQGVTGLEKDKHVPDNRVEDAYDEADSDDETEEDSDEEDSDDSNYGVTYATKEEYVPVEIKTKKKTKGGKFGTGLEIEESQEPSSSTTDNNETWSNCQQQALEAALKDVSKSASDRWDQIGSRVSGKSKEQCMQRCKQLAEQIKKKKMAASS